MIDSLNLIRESFYIHLANVFLMPEFVLIFLILLGVLCCAFIPRRQDKHNTYELNAMSIRLLIYTLIFVLIFVIYWCGRFGALEYFPYHYFAPTTLFAKSKILLIVKSILIMFYIVILLLSESYLLKEGIRSLEYIILTLNALLASFFLISTTSFLSFYLSLEYLSLSLYGLCCFKGYNSSLSIEAGLKYFIIGSIGSSLFLFGFSYLYGITGTLNLMDTFSILRLLKTSNSEELSPANNVIMLSLICIFSGFFLKLAVPPFHMWLPDVYEGSATSTTFFFAIIPKLAFFCTLYRFCYYSFYVYLDIWSDWFIICGGLCLIIGSLSALLQTNLKRFFAYSSITNMGYLFLSMSMEYSQRYFVSTFLFLFIYFINVILFFSVILYIRKKNNNILISKIEDLAGLKHEHPFLALAFLINLLSMAGIPPLAGFWAKYYVLLNIVHQGWYYLAIFMVLSAVLGAVYYLNVIVKLYFIPLKNHLFLYSPNFIVKSIIFMCVIFNIAIFYWLDDILVELLRYYNYFSKHYIVRPGYLFHRFSLCSKFTIGGPDLGTCFDLLVKTHMYEMNEIKYKLGMPLGPHDKVLVRPGFLVNFTEANELGKVHYLDVLCYITGGHEPNRYNYEVFKEILPEGYYIYLTALGDCSTGNCPTGDCPTGDCPTGDCPTGDCPTGDCDESGNSNGATNNCTTC